MQSGKIEDAETAVYYLGVYARDHQGRISPNFEQIAAHLRVGPRDNDHLPWTGINEFEIVTREHSTN